jgi:hypothetical protein
METVTSALDYVTSLPPGTRIRTPDGRVYFTCSEQRHHHIDQWSLFDLTNGTIAHVSEIVLHTTSVEEFLASHHVGDETC